ncbi:hypothetical protein MRB53_012640 [Persea americana]|uniref:Uncharacterized protein n=1 Tax=Persea americana TaxID=3435 RepID=A0ACC2LYU7_PERAE|nr:hypothetical protein MRB53_012640 [Persea americana]
MSFGAFECEAATGSEIDREALLAIKAQIRKDPLGALISWNDTLPFCMWLGVTCISRDQRVMFLDLSSLNLEGSVSPFIGNLSYLVGINFQVNNLDGEIPHEIGNLFNLQLLNLSYNSFQGSIPVSIDSLPNLKVLWLNKNSHRKHPTFTWESLFAYGSLFSSEQS